MNLIDQLLNEATPEEVAQIRGQMPAHYRYGMRLREIGIGCQPPGHVTYEPSSKSQTGFYGILSYEDKLTTEQVNQYELTPLP